MPNSLISADYARLNAQMHGAMPHYGAGSSKYAGAVRSLAARLGCRSVLDYGCGKGTLRPALGFAIDVREYDPAIEGKEERPDPADLVVCTDVLEHVEPDCLDAVLDDLKRCALTAVFLVIATRPAKKTLPDGRNAHLIVEPAEWWLPKLFERFRIVCFDDLGGEFMAVGRPK